MHQTITSNSTGKYLKEILITFLCEVGHYSLKQALVSLQTNNLIDPTMTRFPKQLQKAMQIFIAVFTLFFNANFSFAQNAIVVENALPGNPSSEWDINGAGDLTIQGFATDISVNKGQTVHFKIKTDASAYEVKIYRLGYYQGNGARLIDSAIITVTLPQTQPADLYDVNTGLLDCGSWNESAHWDVPVTAVSGIYIAKLIRTDNGGASHIVFIVRDDAGTSDLYFKTSDATWQAYNVYGGNSLYVGNTSYPSGHAAKVSYNRPFITRDGNGGGGPEEDWVFNAEYPMIRWLERNGYDVSYTTDVDADRNGNLILNHNAFLSVGHDEYWSAQQRSNVEAARSAGVHLAFFSGNEIYWKTRWENSTDVSGTPYRTLVCYKEGELGENSCGTKCDPLPNVWTGLWREGCDYPLADGCNPENALSGQISWDGTTGAIEVPDTYKDLRFWRNTSVATLAVGQTAIFSAGTLGYEWDWEQYTASYPAGRIRMSETVLNTHAHHLSLYRSASGALVFGAGTVQWSWGLDGNHDRGGSVEDIRMQQATVNLFADMGVQPGTLQAGLVAATASTDVQAPVSIITSPLNGDTLPNSVQLVITGTATDNILVAGVEVSVDGGATWHAASGTNSWSYTWTPFTPGPVNIKSRAFDDSGNLEIPGPGITDTVSQALAVTCPCTIFQPADVPVVPLANDGNAIELGVKFQSSTAGFITGLRFYKGNGTTGTHTGHLWTSTGTLLASEIFVSETASGWQEVTLATPVAIDANTTYIASSFSSSGDYPYTDGFFVNAVTHGTLRALADGEDGPNGVYSYGAVPLFPTNTFNSGNYWIDIVFAEITGPDTIAPTVSITSPLNAATAVGTGTSITATFSEGIDQSTLSASTFELRDASSALVAANITYNTAAHTATLDPNAMLSYSATYTVTVKGGLSYNRIKDLSGNAMVADYTWSFTTASVPPPLPTEGTGGPILLISSSVNPFSRYPVEILRAEGFNEFTAMDITAINATVLNQYQVVIAGEFPLTAAEVTLLTNWTNAGGTLIAFRPDVQLAPLMGITPTGNTLADQYLLVNTAVSPGNGIVNQTMQYHGMADLYTLSGATAIATLYSNATTSTPYPAVTIRNVGSNGGQAIAFTYDLARSIVYTRQGNPAWSGQKRDGQPGPIRSDDQFFPDWIDLNKVAIPQADEQQHLLSNIIISGNLDHQPLPRFWFLPKGLKAAVVMTGDNHGDDGMQPRFELDIAQSAPGCSVNDWECIRSTGYLYTGAIFTDSMAHHYDSLGFEVALHVNTNCLNFTTTQYNGLVTAQLSDFLSSYPSVPTPATNRNHCIAWSDWSTVPETEAANGLRFDVNYYYWPDTWVANRPGMFTGSGMPMRFAKMDGSLIDCYQAPTQMTDESGIVLPAFCDALLDKANGPEGYYGVFVTNMHIDLHNHPGANAIVASAQAHNVPVVSAKQMLDWIDARNNSSFGSMTWNGNVLDFTINADTNARNMKAMIPTHVNSHILISVTLNSLPVSYTVEMIKGIEYAFIPAVNGNYQAIYNIAPPLIITNVTATPHVNGTATISWTTNNAADSKVDYDTTASVLSLNTTAVTLVTSHSILLTGLTAGETYYFRVTSVDGNLDSATEPEFPSAPLNFIMPSASYCAHDENFSDFSTGADTNTIVVLTEDGEVILQPASNEEFTNTTVPAGWSDEIWDNQPAAVTAYNGQTITVNGTHVYTNAAFGPATSIEFAATFTSGSFQNVGFTSDSAFNSPWVVIGQGVSDGNVYARTSDNESVSLGAGLLNAQHIYRIERNTSTGGFTFYVDGNLIPTPGIALTNMINLVVQISDYPAGGPGLSVDWIRILPYASTGTFTSRIFDKTDSTAWGTVFWTDSIPAGTSLLVVARGGNTSLPDTSWSAYQPMVNGTPAGITSRYLQYKVNLSTTNSGLTPVLKDIRFGCSIVIPCIPPVAYISAVDTLLCQGDLIQLQLDSATGQSPFTLVVNAITYTNVIPGQVFATFQSAEMSLWGSSGSPANANGNDGQPIEVGVKFKSSVNGFVKGVRFYKGSSNTGTHTGSLWTKSGSLLATATFSSETVSGWQEVRFSTPVYVHADTTYIASYYSPLGGFAITPNYFSASSFNNGYLTALQTGAEGPNGVYAYGGGFPSGGNNGNYWVDVLFAREQAGDSTTNYILSEVTDNNGCNVADDSLSIVSVTTRPLPAGTLVAGSVCTGENIYLTFNANSGSGPFNIVINSTTYNGVMSGVPFNTGIAASSSVSQSVWDTTIVPGTISVTDNASIELGMKFRSDTAGKVTGIRFYKGPTNTGTHTGSLWTITGTLLATGTFTNETASGWQEMLFSAPVTISANTTYIVSYHAQVGYYSFDPAYFASSSITNGHLRALQNGEDGANGLYKYNSTTIFPTDNFNSANYWVDVLFVESDNMFTLSSVTNASGCSVLTGGNAVTPVLPMPVSAAIASHTNVKCKVDATGSAVVQATGGSGGFTYLWNDALAQTNDTATGLAAGVYSVRIIDVSGCSDTAWASVVITEPVTILSTSVTHTNAQCYNEANGQAIVSANGGNAPYLFNWSNATTNDTLFGVVAGNYWVTVTDSNLCTLSDTIPISQPVQLVSAHALTICNGDNIIIGSHTYNSTGVFVDTLTAVSGCDSTVTTNLTVRPAITSTQTITVCNGGSVTVGTTTHNASGTYVDILSSAFGCDSTVTTNLTVRPAITSTQTLTVCNGGSVTVGTITHNASGIYADVLTAASGCDSTVTTNLTVLPVITSNQALTVCYGGSITVGTITHNTSGIYSDVLTTASGCDSTVTTNLTVLPVITSSQTLTVCNGGSVTVGTTTHNASGTYVDVLSAVSGCDSTVTTNLTVLPLISSSQTLTVCNGGSVTVGTITHNTSGTYADVLAAANGCDSTITTHLTVLPVNATVQSLTICHAGSVVVGPNTYYSPGVYLDTLSSVNGCDSTVTTTLSILPLNASMQWVTICYGDSILVGTQVHSTSGSYVDTLTSSNGCDSIITTSLLVLSPVSLTQNATVCNGGNIQVGNNIYNVSGTYTDTLATLIGCDSIVITNLVVLPVITNSVSVSICGNDSLYAGGAWQTTSGIFNDTLVTAGGCDSILVTSLTVNTSYSNSQSLAICAGDSIFLGGAYQYATGLYSDTLFSQSGCDSIIVTSLIVNIVDTSVTVYGDTLVANAGGTTFQWMDSGTNTLIAGATDSLFIPIISGMYAVIVTENGCSDTSSSYSIIVDGITETSPGNLFSVYPNPTKDILIISISGEVKSGIQCKLYNILGEELINSTYENNTVIALDIQYLPVGTYFLHIRLGNATQTMKVLKD